MQLILAALIILPLFFFPIFDLSWTRTTKFEPITCGSIFNKSSDNKAICSDPSYEVICENSKAVVLLYYDRHQVEVIMAVNSSTSRIVTNNCSVINSGPLPYEEDTTLNTVWDDGIIFVRCGKRVENNRYYQDLWEHCRNGISERSYYSYALPYYTEAGEVEESCSIEMKVIVRRSMERNTCSRNCSYDPLPEIKGSGAEYGKNGIELRWRPFSCGPPDPTCKLDAATNSVLCPTQNYADFLL